MKQSGKLVASAVSIAFGVVLPMVFHMTGIGGSIFLPMHIPVMIAGLFLGMRWGLIVGGCTPILSCLLTGMPPVIPILPIMAVELAVYGYIGGFLYRNRQWSIWLALLGSMVAGRAAAACGVFFMVQMVNVNLHPLTYITGAVMQGLPGIALQIILIPMVVSRLEKAFCSTFMDEMMINKVEE
ncbi:MAG: ECF transporter S component [Pelosinus sp.]|nr:ECF transporter S component [Pelosinus sp.]